MKEKRYLVSTKRHDLLRETKAAKAVTKSKLEAQEDTDKKNSEPLYFTHS